MAAANGVWIQVVLWDFEDLTTILETVDDREVKDALKESELLFRIHQGMQGQVNLIATCREHRCPKQGDQVNSGQAGKTSTKERSKGSALG